MSSLVINIEKVEQSKDQTTLTLTDSTGVYNATTNPTGYGSAQLPATTREVADIDKSIIVMTYKDVDYTINLDSTTTPTAQDFANQTSNLDITGANLGGTSADKLDNGIFNLDYTVGFDDLKVATLSGILSSSIGSTGNYSTSIPNGNYIIWIAAIDGGGNLSNAVSTALTWTAAGVATTSTLTFTGVNNAVSYRIFFVNGTTYYYKDVTTTSALTFTSGTLTTTAPSSLITNLTKGYTKYVAATTSFETQGIVKKTYASMGYSDMDSLIIDNIPYTISSLATTTKAVVNNPDATAFVDSTYYRTDVAYLKQAKVLLIGQAGECLVNTIVKLPEPCCDDCGQEALNNAYKFYMIYLAIQSLFDNESYTAAQQNIDWIDAVCSDTNPCGC